MLDYKFIVENKHSIAANIADRFMKADVQEVVRQYTKRTELTTHIQSLQQKRNANTEAMKSKLVHELNPELNPEQLAELKTITRNALIEEGKKLKEEIAAAESELAIVENVLLAEALKIPNMAHPDAPVGRGESDNIEIKRFGLPTTFAFEPADHVKLGHDLDIIDFDSATKVSGTKFYYLKNQGVFLELGLIRYALDILQKKGFTPFITPDIAREEILEGIGFNPRGTESNVYTLEGEGTCLVGTSEITLGGYYSNTIIPKDKLPIRMAGLSHCFRREAGAAGQFSKGLYRVHQFTKVEMFIYCLPEESDRFHEELRSIEEEIFENLKIPFRVVDTCTGDLGAPAYRKYDLEAWMPGRAGGSNVSGDWGEITSTSNCTDYQARRLNIRYKDLEDGKNKFVHMLNGTAIAVSRAIIAILENFQQADGSVRIPKALVPYTGFEYIKKQK
jgi:seryl-tRNA synthetase